MVILYELISGVEKKKPMHCEINNEELVLIDELDNIKNTITSKDGDTLEKEPRILECLKQIKQKEKLLRVCI